MTTFYFVRHGQTNANAENLKQGQINTLITQLNDFGVAQVKRLADKFDFSFADQLIASPLDRTIQTAKILNHRKRLPLTTDDRLLEISYGQWDGQSNGLLQNQYSDVFDQVIHDVTPDYVKYAGDGETFEQVVRRVKAFLDDMTKQWPNDQIVVVTHGFTIKAVVMTIFGITSATKKLPEPDNASVTKLTQTLAGDRYLYYYNRA